MVDLTKTKLYRQPHIRCVANPGQGHRTRQINVLPVYNISEGCTYVDVTSKPVLASTSIRNKKQSLAVLGRYHYNLGMAQGWPAPSTALFQVLAM